MDAPLLPAAAAGPKAAHPTLPAYPGDRMGRVDNHPYLRAAWQAAHAFSKLESGGKIQEKRQLEKGVPKMWRGRSGQVKHEADRNEHTRREVN